MRYKGFEEEAIGEGRKQRRLGETEKTLTKGKMMASYIRILIAGVVVFFIAGCSTYSGGWNGERPSQPLKHLNVVVDLTALEFIDPSLQSIFSTDGGSAITHYNAILAQELSKQLIASGVDVNVKSAGTIKVTNRLGALRTNKDYRPPTDVMIKLFEPSDHYVLIMNIHGYPLDRFTNRWLGNVSFGYELIKPNTWPQEKKAVWELKKGASILNYGATKIVSLDDQNCGKDEKISCIPWVVRELIKALKDQKIIPQHPS